MEGSINMSLPHQNCMKCGEEHDILLSSSPIFGGCSHHKFCQSCFRKENADLPLDSDLPFTCPCCHTPPYKAAESFDEAILLD